MNTLGRVSKGIAPLLCFSTLAALGPGCSSQECNAIAPPQAVAVHFANPSLIKDNMSICFDDVDPCAPLTSTTPNVSISAADTLYGFVPLTTKPIQLRLKSGETEIGTTKVSPHKERWSSCASFLVASLEYDGSQLTAV